MRGRSGGARSAAQRVAKSVAEVAVHPAVDDGIVTTVAHRDPVAADPDRLNVLERPDFRVGVSDQGDAVQGQPAEGVYHHDHYHHLHHL